MTNSVTPDLPVSNASVDTANTLDCANDMRAQLLAAHGLESLQDDPEMARIVRFAAKLCEVPASLISIVETDRQWFLAREGHDARETPRTTSFCAHTMLGNKTLVVPDATKDPRFADFSLVTGPENIRFYAGAPLLAEDGTPIGALCVIDVEPRPEGLLPFQIEGLETLANSVMCRMHHNRERLEAEHALEFSEVRLRTILNGVPQIAWSSDALGHFDYFNKRWTEVTGGTEPFYAQDWKPFIHPEDWPETLALWIKCFEDLSPFECQYRLRQADGSYHWILARAVPISSTGKKSTRWSGTITDVDASYRHAESRELLSLELSHRIKNIFAVISGLISLTSRSRPEASEFAVELNSKVRALGRAHDFVRPVDNEKGDSLHGLLSELMKPYVEADEERVIVEGDGITIGVKSATPLALVFHEFATNSAKYGALSVPEGRVSVSLTRNIAGQNDDEFATIVWQERGGPAPDTPKDGEKAHEGFGTRLIEMTVTSQLRGQLTRELRPEGFMARLTIPLSAL